VRTKRKYITTVDAVFVTISSVGRAEVNDRRKRLNLEETG